MLSSAMLAAGAAAQDFRQSVPRLPEPVPPTVGEAPGVSGLAAADPTPILGALVGVRFVADPALLAGDAPGVDVSAVPALDTPAFRARAGQDLGKPASLASLEALARDAVAAHRVAGRPLVDIAIPEQDVTDGIVTFVVREFRVGEVIVEGNRYFPTDRLRGMIRLASGDTVDQRELVEDLSWIATNPFRRVDLLYRRADARLTTDVIVRVTDRAPWRAYLSFENNGTPTTGRERWSAGINWGDAFGADGQLAYQYTTSSDLFQDRDGLDPRFQAHSLTWVQPLASRQTFILFGTYQRVVPRVDPIFGVTGENWQVSPRFVIPLRGRSFARAQVTLGYDFKQTDNNLLFGGVQVSDQATQIHQAVIDLTLSRRWLGGLFSADQRLVLSPGGIGSRNTDEAFRPGEEQTGTPFARARYAYWRSTLTQTTPLPQGAESVSRLTAQLSTANLLPSEQLSVTGPGFVRAYDPNSVLGTRGLIFSQDLWGPPISLLAGTTTDALRLGGFFDAGIAGNPDRLPGEPTWTRATSVGVMARYQLGPWLDARLDFGTQLRQQPGRTRRGELGFVTITLGF
jgi:hemolysin activation/secretion protein